MLAAYIMQIIITILAWFWLRLTHRWIPDFQSQLIRPFMPFALEERLKDRAITEAFIARLDDFQKTQIFFALAVEISYFWSQSHLPDVVVASLQQMKQKIEFFALVAAAGS